MTNISMLHNLRRLSRERGGPRAARRGRGPRGLVLAPAGDTGMAAAVMSRLMSRMPLLILLLTCAALCPRGSTALHVFVDPASAKHAFGGIGGISGGGATSALLRSYPRQQREQILDLLFNRSFAASLPILKVEIGGVRSIPPVPRAAARARGTH